MAEKKVPLHVALIPDGNRRWAKKKGLVATAGHVRAGAYENLYPLLKEARDLGIKYISLWGFSTENWKREKREVDKILDVISKGLDRLGDKIEKEKFSIKHIGRKDRLPKEIIDKMNRLEVKTSGNKELCVLLCIDYGGRDEIVRAVKKFVETGKKDCSEEEFMNYLDTARIPEPDLLIRTGNDNRLSGFMPFQSTYAELLFLDKYFPDFKPEDLRKAVEDFGKRDRRFGAG
ncbi:MAG: polyprenyl diphosphate synthase [archaeon]